MQKLIDTFKKKDVEEVRTQLTEYKGYDLVDIRVWFTAPDGQEPRPTRKGITLRICQLPELGRAVKKAIKEASRN